MSLYVFLEEYDFSGKTMNPFNAHGGNGFSRTIQTISELMARQITGDSAHEWLGVGMLILWILHHILNRSWYSRFFNGKYMPIRILQTEANFAVLLSMLGLYGKWDYPFQRGFRFPADFQRYRSGRAG